MTPGHDQRFKALLKAFFPELLRCFFPQYAAGLDFSQIEWLDKEVLVDPPQGDVYVLDLVARVRRLPKPGSTEDPGYETFVLIHVETESREAVEQLRRRMYQYYEGLRRTYNCPVLPIAVYLRVGLDGVGVDEYVEKFEDLEVLRFRYLYVGLPGLDAEKYVAGDNWLGVALSALMRIPKARKAWLGSEALRRLVVECQGSAYQKRLLRECVEAYIQLDEEQKREFDQILETEPYREVKTMLATTFEQGVDKGQRLMLRRMVEHRFGTLSPAVQQRLDDWPADRLDELISSIWKAQSLQELGLGEPGESIPGKQ